MKITKSRLLQIIREEVELHEKNLEENTFELDEELSEEEISTEEEADKDGDGKISKPEAKAAIDAEVRRDTNTGNDGKNTGNHGNVTIKITSGKKESTHEDRLFTKEKPHKIIQPKKQNDI